MTREGPRKAKPFLKWVGGKRWFAEKHRDILPQCYKRYFEPFLGSGAVFFRLLPKKSFLSDANPDLIAVYKAIRADWRNVWRHLLCHRRHHSKEHYYRTRSSGPRTPASRAAKFIYLNRTCFNGLYRVNQEGVFNVPKGTKESVVLPDDDFGAVAEALKGASLTCRDFGKALANTREGDFVYADPPYTVKHNMNNFVKYNESLFSWEDQQRLAAALTAASERGVMVMLSNADCPDVRALYPKSVWSFHVLTRASLLASSGSKRKTTTELAISNYTVEGANQETAGHERARPTR